MGEEKEGGEEGGREEREEGGRNDHYLKFLCR